jgi:hypothetical protein
MATDERIRPGEVRAWHCYLCGQTVLIPAGANPLTTLNTSSRRQRERVVWAGNAVVHRCAA